jgi:uncharacterized membrane protein
MSLRTLQLLSATLFFLYFCPTSVNGQATQQAPKAQTPAKTPPAAPAAPQSTHYPILLLAFGNDPVWSLRIGQKGPERLDRANYPPIPLEPADVAHEAAADSWTYHAKDSATGATVAVHIVREVCEGPGSPATVTTSGVPVAPISGQKFTFRATVEHAQIGTLSGCARIAAELFPKIINQAADDDDTDKKKPDPPTITNFKSPVAVAYLNAAHQLVLKRGTSARVVSAKRPIDFSLSHDGKKLLFTRSDSDSDTADTLQLYDFDSAKSRELLHGPIRQAFWSPDDSRIALLKRVDSLWQAWTLTAGATETAAVLYNSPVISLHGWIDAHTVLATDQKNALWISDDKAPLIAPLENIYGNGFQISSLDTIRVHPLNPDLLLVSASSTTPPPGHAKDAAAPASSLFLYELLSKRRVILTSPEQSAQRAEWSRDGLQIFFTGTDASHRVTTFRIFWDGTSMKRYTDGASLVIGQ